MITAPPSLDPHTPLPPRPVTLKERLSSVDALRGFALLGILAMNIIAFALPGAAYLDPQHPAMEQYQGSFTGWNRIVWWITYLFFDQKMMSIFSMLFGAGLVLMGGRARDWEGAPPAGFARIYYRRLFWLLVIGLIHAHLIWYGDILVSYALCGVFLYPRRHSSPRRLILIGLLGLLVAVPLNGFMGFDMLSVERDAREVQVRRAAGETISPEQQRTLDKYDKTVETVVPNAEKIDNTVAAMRGSASEVISENSREARFFETVVFFIWTLWRASGLMFIGMGLMKLGVFSASLRTRAYLRMALIGYGVGLPIVLAGGLLHIEHNFDAFRSLAIDDHFNYIGSVGVALGHVGVVMLICRLGALPFLRARLAAVGQMALTNYVTQSLLMTFIFYGWGLGYFGHVERAPLYYFVLGVWMLQLIWSPIWLSKYRFGPAEWVWRSLTYWRRQPMRRQPDDVHS